MKLHAIALAVGLMVAGGTHAAVNNLALTDTWHLGSFSAPDTYGDAFAVSTPGTIDHSLTFTILTDLYAGSGVSDIPLDVNFGAFTLTITNIDGLSAEIYDSNNALYTTFVSAGDPDHLTLPPSSLFVAGDYTLKIGGYATGEHGGMYTVAAVTVPVPEPETWGMLLAGLGLLGLRLRHKRVTSPA